ncbi:MAG TPA: transposase, partial [Arenibacter sp.]|nr:transposase [Arenibacter sp.]
MHSYFGYIRTISFLPSCTAPVSSNCFRSLQTTRSWIVQIEGELDAHLGYGRHARSDTPNARNGHGTKKIRTGYGDMQIRVPRNRDASFDPMLVPKRKSMVDGIENVIISLYSKGMTVSDIEEQIREVYDFDISPSTISRITDAVVQDIAAWQNRPLEPVYLIVWMDGIVFKVRQDSKVVNKTIYIAVGLRRVQKTVIVYQPSRIKVNHFGRVKVSH